MNNEILRDLIVKELKTRGFNIVPKDIEKNGVLMHGIVDEDFQSIRSTKNSGIKTMPIAYVEEIVGEYGDNLDVSDYADLIATIFNTCDTPYVDIEELFEPDKFASNIRFELRSVPAGDAVFRESPFKGIIEQLVSRVEYGSGFLSMAVNDAILKKFGMTQEEAWRRARENLEKDVQVRNVVEMTQALGGAVSDPTVSDPEYIPMYIVTSRSAMRGSACIRTKTAVEQLKKAFGLDRFIVMPSSIHEMIVIPDSGLDVEAMTSLVREVNATSVTLEERLGNSAYRMTAEELIS